MLRLINSNDFRQFGSAESITPLLLKLSMPTTVVSFRGPKLKQILPSDRRQILVLTYPLVGNYGVPSQPTEQWAESHRIWAGQYLSEKNVRQIIFAEKIIFLCCKLKFKLFFISAHFS
jgi:hypothetical protein